MFFVFNATIPIVPVVIDPKRPNLASLTHSIMKPFPISLTHKSESPIIYEILPTHLFPFSQ
uniref:Uncharacterized protein n=1 Tax=Picea glauca TaxID=3330 RepID=A0A101LWV5_PICGL|nr:hypothetical protein ABT39_MTgene1328 [Picea glauca]